MTSLAVRAAAALVRGWTRLYTQRLPVAIRERRRVEIESDLWESQRDAPDGRALGTAAGILARFFLGIPDDLVWWVEQATVSEGFRHRTVVVCGRIAGSVISIGALWAINHDVTRDHAIVLLAPGLTAQSAGTTSIEIRFEVTSVKPNPTGRAGMTQSRLLPGGRFVATNMPVRLLIGRAYDVPSYRLIGGPGWIENEAFDIVATANRDLAPAGGQRPLEGALRGLLAERFRLVVHTETRQLPGYALVFARDDHRLGSSLTRSERADCAAILAEVAARAAGVPPPPPLPGGQAPPCGAFTGIGLMSLDSATVARFSDFLSAELNRKVFDRTGLSGRFNVRLVWTPDPLPAGPLPPDAPPIDPNGPSLFTALQEQLGLKLESTTGPVEIVVIDRIERPAPN
jgi:uncharacterized protein (TIGR03435 family)